MIEMENTLQALESAGLRDSVKIIVGGAPVTQSFLQSIGFSLVLKFRTQP